MLRTAFAAALIAAAALAIIVKGTSKNSRLSQFVRV
jgi:hypothetical protein